MTKLVVVSDSHLRPKVLETILKSEKDVDYYIHCGDCELRKEKMEPFLVVEGNHDYLHQFPKERVLEINGYKILIIHGHLQGVRNVYQRNIEDYMSSQKKFTAYCEKQGVNLVLFGHIHRYIDQCVNGIRYINPGSCAYSRDWGPGTYCVINIVDNQIDVCKKELSKHIF